MSGNSARHAAALRDANPDIPAVCVLPIEAETADAGEEVAADEATPVEAAADEADEPIEIEAEAETEAPEVARAGGEEAEERTYH